MQANGYFAHESSYVDEGAFVGPGTKIWHFCHVDSGAQIGKNCSIGQNVYIAGNVVVGDNVKIQNNVSLFDGVIVEDDVFLGPSCVLTNVSNPRSQVERKSLYEPTVLKRGCTIGANATIVCGVTIGRYAFVAAGSVVTKDLLEYSLVKGVPGIHGGWISRHGHPLSEKEDNGFYVCPESGYRYEETLQGSLVCIDLDEDSVLPAGVSKGKLAYREARKKQ